MMLHRHFEKEAKKKANKEKAQKPVSEIFPPDDDGENEEERPQKRSKKQKD